MKTGKLNLLLILLLAACTPETEFDYSDLSLVNSTSVQAESAEFGTVPIDIHRSRVEWRGTKLLGTGKHEGTVAFMEGQFRMSGDRITGGHFSVDMASISVTDIPNHERTARRNLTRHLNSDFAIHMFPTAAFTIRDVMDAGDDKYLIFGDLSIRGVTKPITITAIKSRNLFTSEFSFNRFDWKIGEDGTWLERRLVDAEIHLVVTISTE